MTVGYRTAYPVNINQRRYRASSSTIAAACSPIMILGRVGVPATTCGMIEASATRSPATPCTRNRGSTTVFDPVPIAHELLG